MALGAGYVNSWIETFTYTQNPCLRNVLQGSSGIGDTGSGGAQDNSVDTAFGIGPLSTCAFWLVAGLVIGSLRFKKKGQTA
jgi:hypothetical protein